MTTHIHPPRRRRDARRGGGAAMGATRRFARHYLEMIVVMVLGMVVLGAPADAVFHVDGTGPMLIEMASTMTLPMVAWMRFRGHGWRPSMEMAASMIVPTLGTLALLGAGVVEDVGALMIIEHAAMLPSMLLAMLLRRAEYSCDHGGHAPVAA